VSYCGQAYPIVQPVQKQFGKRLRLVFRNFPLSEMRPDAEAAAEVAEFAGAQGKFWEMHDKLYENQNAWAKHSIWILPKSSRYRPLHCIRRWNSERSKPVSAPTSRAVPEAE
jgi:protein-disulfide isomerase